MLDEAIKLMEKQIITCKVLKRSIKSNSRWKTEEKDLRASITKEIQIRDYILDILNKQKK